MLARRADSQWWCSLKEDEAVKYLLASNRREVIISDEMACSITINRDIEVSNALNAKTGHRERQLLPVGHYENL